MNDIERRLKGRTPVGAEAIHSLDDTLSLFQYKRSIPIDEIRDDTQRVSTLFNTIDKVEKMRPKSSTNRRGPKSVKGIKGLLTRFDEMTEVCDRTGDQIREEHIQEVEVRKKRDYNKAVQMRKKYEKMMLRKQGRQQTISLSSQMSIIL